VKFVQEKKLIAKFFDEISQDTGRYCFGVEDTLKALELGAVETLIVWENLDINRYVLRNAAGGITRPKTFNLVLITFFSRGNRYPRKQRTGERSRKIHGQIHRPRDGTNH
jgi:eRF1 domain 3